MLKNISLGMYYPGNSLLHRLQARTKLLILLAIVVSLSIAEQREWHFAPFIALIVLLCVAVALSSVSFQELWGRMWLLVVLTLIGSFTLLFSTEGKDDKILYTIGPLAAPYAIVRDVAISITVVVLLLFLSSFLSLSGLRRSQQRLRRFRFLLIVVLLGLIAFLWLTHNAPATSSFSPGSFSVTRSGVWSLVSLAVILLALYAFSLLLTMTTSPVALIEGLTMLLSPLRRLKLPVDDFALMALLALRFIPTLLEEVELLIKAQSARGADVANGTVRERLQSLSMLFIPLMQGVLRRASELATALEARGYEVEGRQTRLYEKSLGKVDYAVLGVVVLVMGGALLL